MISVPRVPEPEGFDERCRRRGQAWRAKHPDPDGRPPDYWSEFKPVLARGFRDLCGYGAMWTPVGSVDHYLSWDNAPEQAFEWSNYRFAEEWINKSKQTADAQVLDPFEIGEDWFEILLPSLQLVVSDRCPPEHRERAEFTLTRLHLRHDERVLRQRREWYRMYCDGELSLEGLARKAPLIAQAVTAAAGAA